MIFPFHPEDPLQAAAADFLLTGATVVEDTEDRLILKRGLLIYGLGRADKSEIFRNGLMTLCFDPDVAEHLLKDGCFDDHVPCLQYVYTGKSIAVPEPSGFAIRELAESDAAFLTENYHHPSATLRHMKERIRSGMLGATVDGKLCGFIGTHDEGAIGLLEVLPEYRRMGIARTLECTFIDRLLKEGRIPYTHVRLGNDASSALQLSLGMTEASGPVCWLCKNDAYRSANLM